MSAKEMTAVVNVAGQMDPSVKKAVESAQKQVDGLKKKTMSAGLKAAAAFAAVGGAAVMLAKQVFDLGTEFESAYKTIRIGTGATGDALKELQNDFKQTLASVPTDMQTAAGAIADYNTRLGLTGPTLQELSKQAINLSECLGAGGVSEIVEKSSQAFQAWNIDSSDMSKEMDYLFRVSQSTGISFQDLAQQTKENATVFQSLGFDFDTAAAALGQVQKAGLNTSDVMAALSTAVKNSGANGTDAAQDFLQYYDAIKNTKDATKAAGIAAELFGKKQAATMVKAIKSGTLNAEELAKTLVASGDTINDLSWQTMNAGQKFTILQNKLKVALEPLASWMIDIANKGMNAIAAFSEQAGPIFAEISAYIKDMGEKAQEFSAFVSQNWGFIAPVVAGVTTAIVAYTVATNAAAIAAGAHAAVMGVVSVETGIYTAAMTAGTAITSAFGAALAFVTSPIGLIVLAIGAAVAAGVALYQNWDTVKNFVSGMWDTVKVKWDEFKAYCGEFTDSAIAKWTDFKTSLCNIATGIGDFIKTVFDGLVGIVLFPFRTTVTTINEIIGAINGISVDIPDWVPIFGGKKFGVNIPLIPTFAKGGFTDGVSIAGEAGKEAVISFNSAFRSANIGYLAQAANLLGVGSNASATSSFLSGITGSELSSNSSSMNFGGITYAPNINISGTESGNLRSDLMGILREHGAALLDMIEELKDEKERTSYDNYGIF